jgi:uncharacterized membrane protein
MKETMDTLLQAESEYLRNLQSIVRKAIKEEKLIVQNVMNQHQEALTAGEKLSDRVASFGGSWKFILLFLAILGLWIIYNSAFKAFDPYPFILLNLMLSLIAALQAPIIMMSQNRQEQKDRKRSENDYLINLKAEIEIRTLHEKMDLLIEQQFKALIESQQRQLNMLQEIVAKMKN